MIMNKDVGVTLNFTIKNNCILTKMILYYWHERIWYKQIKFGVKNV